MNRLAWVRHTSSRGVNSALGLETARHLVEFKSSCVVLAVRNLTAGENAKSDIEKTTGRKGVVEVWHIDMASTTAIQAFAKKVTEELDRIDGVVCNAGIMIDTWSTTEDMETSITVNAINPLLLGALLLPKLRESGRKHTIKPTLVFIVSVLGYTAKAEMDKNLVGESVFAGLNDEKRANMDQRYALSKLIEECAVRRFAALCPVERTSVVINMVAPGLCSTGLGRNARTFVRVVQEAVRAMMGRSAEVGSRTYLHGLVAGEESRGKMLSRCKIKEYWVPSWLSNGEGQKLQERIWTELAERLERVQPGCINQLS